MSFRLPHVGHSPARGVTLVELLVAMAVAGILIAAAAPSFQGIFNGNRLTTAANDLAASLQAARLEAMRRGQRVIICPSADGTTCAAGNPWAGWIVFADANADGAPAAAEVLRWDQINAPMQLWASATISAANRIVFRPDGLAYSNGGLLLEATLAPCIPTSQPAENARDVVILSGSRVAVTRRDADGACAAPLDP